MVPKVARTSYLSPALSFYQKWHLSIRSLSSLIEVILEIYRTLKLEWGGMSGDLGGVRARRGYLDERESVYVNLEAALTILFKQRFKVLKMLYVTYQNCLINESI